MADDGTHPGRHAELDVVQRPHVAVAQPVRVGEVGEQLDEEEGVAVGLRHERVDERRVNGSSEARFGQRPHLSAAKPVEW